jgi:outer membrane putative beta-barrel porin/alpha-amylase
MRRSAWVVFLLVMAGPLALAHAQRCGANAGSTIATDRPQITNSSVAVPCGSLQFENGLQATEDGGRRGYDFPETSARLGVATKTELRLGVPEYYFHDDVGSGFATGLGDMSVGFKQQLGPVRGFDVSLIPSVSLPTGAHRISSHGYDAALQLPWSRGLSKNWTIAGQFAVMWPTVSGRHTATGQASVYIDRQLTAPWDAYVEYSGDYPQRGGPVHGIDFGTAYKISPHQQLDVHGGVGLSAAAPDYSIGAGYSVRFQVFGVK